VLLGVANSWIVEPFFEDAPEEMGPLMLLRTARLLRLGKTARVLVQIPTFWMLVRGLLGSVGIMCYTFLVLFGVVYLFSSAAIELIAKNQLNAGPEPDEKFQSVVATYFSSIPQSMLTMVQIMCLDEVSDIYRPLVEKDPILALYFVFVIMVINLLLLNLVTSVILSSTMEQNATEHDNMKQAQDEEWANVLGDLRDIFDRLDEDSSGYLSRSEIVCMEEGDRVRLCHALGASTPLEVFTMLDVENQGRVSLNAFFDRIVDMVLSKGDVDLKRMEKQIETMHWRLKETFTSQLETQILVKRLLSQLKGGPFAMGDVHPYMKPMARGRERQGSGTSKSADEPSVGGAVDSLSRQVPPEEIPTLANVQRQSLSDDELPPWAQEMIESLRSSWDDSMLLCAQQVRQAVARGPCLAAPGAKAGQAQGVGRAGGLADTGPKKTHAALAPKPFHSSPPTAPPTERKRPPGPQRPPGKATKAKSSGSQQRPATSGPTARCTPGSEGAARQQSSTPDSTRASSAGPPSGQFEECGSGRQADAAQVDVLPDESQAEVPAQPPPATADAFFWMPQGAR